ncbi:MAG: VPLPA-CTERM sorting domain-containing protein [Planctomycetaceae bacterium]|nr:VPLPA-CTERM sorting domain-containing protein [Planctomycetaceae bacterium]
MKIFGLKTLWVALAALVAAVAVPTSSVRADFVDIDLTGWETFQGFGDNANSQVRLNIGVGSQVTGFDWSNLEFTSEGASWRSEFTLSVNNFDASEFLDWAPDLNDDPGTHGPSSGSWGGGVGVAGPFGPGAPFTVADGEIWVTVYEGFDDGGAGVRDAVVASGSLRVFFTAVPEPTSALVLFGAAAGLGLVRRRRA